MSQYLTFKFIHKDTDVSFYETCYSTTPARELSSEGIFPHTLVPIKVTPNMLSEYIEIAEDNVKGLRKHAEHYRKQAADLTELLCKCANAEVYAEVKQDIAGMETTATETEEEVENWENYVRHFNHLADLIEENSDDWELYYTNC